MNFSDTYSKKLHRTAYEFIRGPRPRVKSFLLRLKVDLKNRSFKTVDWKNFKQVSVSYLWSKAFLHTFSVIMQL
jgi:hypothetical protein